MKVLIVDDSKAMRMIVSRTLRQMSITIESITEATNGSEALALTQTREFDLIICDWNMPVKNGMDFLQDLRKSGVRTRFGFCTSEATPNMRIVAMRAGAQFFVIKPFTADTFQTAMNGG
ncbi:MAG: response regulator [Myxococcales bacterium]|nr:response regulator [Myxococcales bacterium]